jgi:tetratricopeptide (TPR) repeat protein
VILFNNLKIVYFIQVEPFGESMLPFLDAINPFNPCFTVADFEDALIDINGILIKTDSSSLPPQEKNLLLEKAFHLALVCLNASGKQKTDKQLSFQLAEILRQYAVLYCHDNTFAAKQLLVIAFNLHLYTIGIFNECFDLKNYSSLEDLKKQCEADPQFCYAMEQSVLTMSIDRCVSLAYTDSFLQPSPKKRLYSLAETSRWLGHCYQHLNQTQTLIPQNNHHFSQLFHLSEALHLFIDDESSKTALADLYIQAWSFMHLEACQLYEKALALDPSTEMQVKTALMQSEILFSNGRKKEAASFMQKALASAEKLENNPFLLFSLHDHCASYYMDPEMLDLKAAETHFSKAFQYAEGTEWIPFAIFNMRYAEFKYLMGEYASAKQLIEHSLSTIRKHPHCQCPFLYQAEAMKLIIEKGA